MTIEYYLSLSYEAQWDELWDHGEHIDNYSAIDSKYSLYTLHRFFVEIELCIETEKIIGLHPFQYGYRMEKYIDQVSN